MKSDMYRRKRYEYINHKGEDQIYCALSYFFVSCTYRKTKISSKS